MKKTLLVGLDAACWEYLDPLLADGRLPTLERLMAGGSWGTMRSTMPPWTPAAWASIITGKNPGKHGVYDMTWRPPGSLDRLPIHAGNRSGTPFWRRLNDHGIRVGLMNVPFLHPPAPVDGFLVCGFGAPSSVPDLTYPAGLLDWINDRFGPYKPAVQAGIFRIATAEQVLAAERQHQGTQVEIAAALAQREAVDVLVINLMLPDHANHYMPRMEQVHQAITESDADLQKLIDAFAPDNIMVISDHGSRRVQGDFLLNKWLKDHGYYVHLQRSAVEQEDALNWIFLQLLRKRLKLPGWPEMLLRRLARAIVPWLPEPVAGRFWQVLEQHIPFAREHVQWSQQLDYHQSTLLPGSAYSGLLYFNLEGREPCGFLSRAERGALATELAGRLRTMTDPEGYPLFSAVYTGEELYHGPETGSAPDLILDSYDGRWNILSSYYSPKVAGSRDRYFIANHNDYGWHSRDGIFVYCGPDFQSGVDDGWAHVTDVAPTLLHLYGVPIPDDYDGCVTEELLDPRLREHRPITRQPGDTVERGPVSPFYSGEATEELIERLKDLGYID